MSTWKITDRVIDGLSSSKLSGALPAVDGSALTDVPGITKSASDPATDTNPSGGVGTLWGNTTSGELFACSDATTDNNVWTNIGGGDGDVQPYAFQGTIAGYESGGHGFGTKVDKFSFVSDGNAADVANLYESKKRATATPSDTHGYTAGNYSPNGTLIEKLAYVSDSDGTNVGDLVIARGRSCSQASATNGYMSTGGDGPAPTIAANVERYSFVSDGNAVDIGDVNQKREAPCGMSSSTHGYVAFGSVPATNTIERFAFASDSTVTTMTAIGSHVLSSAGSCSSETHGYRVGGGVTNIIEKFSFSTDSNATDVGDLTASRYLATGTSSTTNGYASGGYPNNSNINKFSFTTDGNASNIGSLTSANYGGAGHQV